mgnify:CR=1 FL=1
MFENLSLEKTFQFLLIILAFLIPLTVFGVNLIIVIICILWLISGNYKSKFNLIVNSKVLISSFIFFLLHVIGLIWTEDLDWGLHIVHKMWYFLLLYPILYTLTKKEYIKYYISAFLLAILLTEAASYLIWFELIEPFKNATIQNPTPFMSHISYNPILAFAIYLVLYEIFLNNNLKKIQKFLYIIFAIIMIINMFITGGRAGQVIFLVMLCILIFQYFNSQNFKALVVMTLVLTSAIFTAYQTSTIFQIRINSVITDIQNYDVNKNTSVGMRLTFAANSWEIIMKNPIIGAGTGDFPIEYKRVNLIKNPQIPNTDNPHNMYILILVQLGLIGLISFLSIFYYQIKFSLLSKNIFSRNVGMTLPLLFLVLMLSDSYLLGHFTSLFFIFFSSFLHKDFERN